jgi:hypothetical protein
MEMRRQKVDAGWRGRRSVPASGTLARCRGTAAGDTTETENGDIQIDILTAPMSGQMIVRRLNYWPSVRLNE